jgi:hypothetical protein
VLGRQDLCRRTVLAANQHGPRARDWRLPWARARHIANGRQNTLTHRNSHGHVDRSVGSPRSCHPDAQDGNKT